jgi:signal transduction histidine kinase
MRAVGSPAPVGAVALAPLVDGVVEELRAANGGAPLPVVVAGSLPVVEGQPAKLAHVFRNLLANALEHTRGRAGARIELGQEPHGDQVVIYVADNGSGIPYEYQARIFEPFRRGPDPRGAGLGLGLALVQQIVQQHGGKVWMESTPGEGSVFRFLLPRSESGEPR